MSQTAKCSSGSGFLTFFQEGSDGEMQKVTTMDAWMHGYITLVVLEPVSN